MQKPWDIASKLRDLAAVGDGARHAAMLLEAAEQLDCLAKIHAELDATEWDSDTPSFIAQHLADIGLTIEEPDEGEEGDDDE